MSKQDHIKAASKREQSSSLELSSGSSLDRKVKAASKREQKKARFHSAEHEQARDKAIKAKGTVVENLSRDNFRVELDNGITILASLCGKIRQHHVRVMVGDSVEVELSPYDLTRGRISFRYDI